jgi:hypothetical protein
VVTVSPNGPIRSTFRDGAGETTRLGCMTVWVADDLGVSRSTQRANDTSDS